MPFYDSIEDAMADFDRDNAPRTVELNLTEREAKALGIMASELGFESPSAWVKAAIAEYGARRFEARLRAIGDRMWPNGAPDPEALGSEGVRDDKES